MEPILLLGFKIFGGTTAEYLFSSVLTCAAVNLATSKIYDIYKKQLADKMVGRNHDIQQAMEKAFGLAVNEIWAKYEENFSWYDKTAFNFDFGKFKKHLLENKKRILFGDHAAGLNDEKIRELILPEKTEIEPLTAEKIQNAKKHANQNFNSMIEPYIANAPSELQKLFRKDLLDRTVFFFREEIKGNERVFRILTLDAIGDLKHGFEKFSQGFEKFSDLWCKSDESLQSLQNRIAEIKTWINELQRLIVAEHEKTRAAIAAENEKTRNMILSELKESKLDLDIILEFNDILLESKLYDGDLKKAYKICFPEVPLPDTSATRRLIIKYLFDISPLNGTEPPLVFACHLFCEMIRDEEVKVKLQNWIRRVDPKLDIKSVCAGVNSRKSQNSVKSLLVRLIPDPNNRNNPEQKIDVVIYGRKESETYEFIDSCSCKKENILNYFNKKLNDYEDEDIQIEFFLPCELISLDVHEKEEDVGKFKSRLTEFYQIIIRIDRYWDSTLWKKIPSKFRKKWKDNWGRLQDYSRDIFKDDCVLGEECEHLSYDTQKFSDKLTSPKHTCLIMTFLPQKPEVLGYSILRAGIPVALWYGKLARDVKCHQTKKNEIIKIFKAGQLSELPDRVKVIRQDAENDLGNHLTLLWDDPNRVPPEYKIPLQMP